MSEVAVQNAILQYLNLRGDCFAWRNNSTGIFDPVSKRFRKPGGFAIRGVSDILGVFKDGRIIAIEVKSVGKEKTVTLEQRGFLDKITKMNGIAMVATDVIQVQKRIDSLL